MSGAQLAERKLLLISPAFHGYYRSIAAGFESLGYRVATHCYDGYFTLGAKMRNKLLHELPALTPVSSWGLGGPDAAREWATERTLDAIRRERPDRVIVIKGDTLDHRVWDELDSRRIPRILWLYDDLSRHDYTVDFLRAVGPVLSYSLDEANWLSEQGVNAHFAPNGFDPHLAPPPAVRREEAVFVGSHYPNREALLIRLQDAGTPVRAWGRGWSHHPVDRLRTWTWLRPNIPAERDIPLAEAYRVQAEGLVAINIHGLQAGLAMRTFEVPGMGGLQAVDRPDVERFYDVGTETLVYSSPDELAELCGRARHDRAWAENIRQRGRRRSLAEHTFAHRAAQIDRWWA